MANYRPEAIASYFDEFGMAEWERLVRTPTEEVRLEIHAHYLRSYMPRQSRVLEIGAGPGRFTQMLSALDCHIVVSDISPVQLDLNRKFAGELKFDSAVEEWLLADICDLSHFDSNSFDAVVCYGGPLSYALDQRERALAECIRVTRPEGLILLSVMSLWGTIHAYLPGVLKVPPQSNHRIIETGDLIPETLPENRHHCHMYRAKELREFLERQSLRVLALSASNSLSTTWEDRLSDVRQSPEAWAELLRMEIESSREEGCLDSGTHIIAVAQKVP